MRTRAGTAYYVAPQVLAQCYDHAVDYWSCGVILYICLCGYPPFCGDSDAEVLEKVTLGNYSFCADDWKSVSSEAKQLIGLLLRINPRDRCTALQGLEHPWMSQLGSERDE